MSSPHTFLSSEIVGGVGVVHKHVVAVEVEAVVEIGGWEEAVHEHVAAEKLRGEDMKGEHSLYTVTNWRHP